MKLSYWKEGFFPWKFSKSIEISEGEVTIVVDYSPTKNPRKSGDFTSLLSDGSEMPLQFARKQYHGSRNGRTLAMNKSLPLKESKGVLSL